MQPKRVSKWLSTESYFYKDDDSIPEGLDAEMISSDPVLAKIYQRDKEFAPETINLDEVQTVNPSTTNGVSTVRFINGQTLMCKIQHEELHELLLAREVYVEQSMLNFLKLMSDKLSL